MKVDVFAIAFAGFETKRIVLFIPPPGLVPNRIDLTGEAPPMLMSPTKFSSSRKLASGVENLKWSVSGRESEGGISEYGVACAASESRALVLPNILPGENEGILSMSVS